jgi:hypothetical protein
MHDMATTNDLRKTTFKSVQEYIDERPMWALRVHAVPDVLDSFMEKQSRIGHDDLMA